MKTPILIISVDSKDMDMFSSQKTATAHMEAVDVLNGECNAFDADGSPLKIVVSNLPPQIGFGCFKIFVGGGTVSLEEDFDNIAERTWLKEFLEAKIESMKNVRSLRVMVMPLYPELWRKELWDIYCVLAPERLRKSVEKYRMVKKAPKISPGDMASIPKQYKSGKRGLFSQDAPMGPGNICSRSLTRLEEAAVAAFRMFTPLPPDDCL